MGAFDDYPTPGAPKKGGAFSDYSAPAAASSASSSSTPWFSAGSGNDKIGEFFAKAGDTATFGLGAKLQDALGIGQKDGQTVAQQVANAGEDIGPIASTGADVLGYVAGPGELRVGEGLGKLAGAALGGNAIARVGGRMLGSGVENAGATILGNAGHDQNTTTGDLLMSLGLGAATGVLPGGRGPRPETPSTADLNAAKKDAFAPLEDAWVNARNTGQNFNKVTSSLPTRTDLSSNFNGKVDEIAKEIGDSSGVLSADTIARYQRVLGGAARNDIDKNAARNYVDALNTSLGEHAPAVADANTLANKFKVSREIDNWLTDPAGAPSAIASRLNKKPQFYQGDVGDALREIGAKAPSDESIASAAGKAAASAIGKHLLGAAIGGGVGYMTGQGLPGDIAGLALGAAVPSAAGRIASRVASIPTRNALLAAQHLNATGIPVSPGVYTPRWLQGLGVMSRQAGYGMGASGAL